MKIKLGEELTARTCLIRKVLTCRDEENPPVRTLLYLVQKITFTVTSIRGNYRDSIMYGNRLYKIDSTLISGG